MAQTINTVGADLQVAVAKGASGELPVVANVDGVEKELGTLVYMRGDVILDTGAQDADRIVVTVLGAL